MKKLMALFFLGIPVRLLGFEMYAWDSQVKYSVEKFDTEVLDTLKADFKENKIKFQSYYINNHKVLVYRKSNTTICAFNEKGEIIQYSGPLKFKVKGQNQDQVEFVDLIFKKNQ